MHETQTCVYFSTILSYNHQLYTKPEEYQIILSYKLFYRLFLQQRFNKHTYFRNKQLKRSLQDQLHETETQVSLRMLSSSIGQVENHNLEPLEALNMNRMRKF